MTTSTKALLTIAWFGLLFWILWGLGHLPLDVSNRMSDQTHVGYAVGLMSMLALFGIWRDDL